MTNFKREYQIKANDELWMVIDRDRWTVRMLSEIHRQCKQKGIGLCISNPCFELWLILHYQDITAFGADTQELLLTNQKQHGQSYMPKDIFLI